MNTDEVRAQFDKFEQVDVMWGGKIKYSNKRNEYYCPNSYWAQDTRDLNQRWEGHQRAYQQATKESALQNISDFGQLQTALETIDELKAKVERLEVAGHTFVMTSKKWMTVEARKDFETTMDAWYEALKEADHG